MKNYYFLIAGIAGLILAGFLVFVVQAQDEDPFASITYPVPELGNCVDKEDCLNYCDSPDNMAACLDFAEENNLLPEEDIEMGKKMLAAGETLGPGGCQGVAECQVYCDDISHIRECVAFAEDNDLIPADELEEAKKVIAALDRGIEPPPCNSKSECDQVCTRPENMKACITFAKEAGLMPPEELEEAEKVLAAIEKGAVPPACGGKDECDEYCAAPENFEQCITFAEAAGFVSPEEATMARRTGGKGPGNCRGKEECEAFCEDPANAEPCINFAEEFGFMSAEEAEQARKMMAAGMNIMQGGPGGCKGKEECEAFCDDISHMTECVDFAERAGMMSPEDAARARKMAERGINMMGGGPGGCKSEEECRAFCEDQANMEECLNFAVQIGEMSPEEAEQGRRGMEAMMQGGPGGCQGDECRTYCDDVSHNEECVSWALESGMIPPEEAERMNQARQMMEQGEFGPGEGFRPEERFGPEGMPPEEGVPGGMPPEGMMPEGIPPEMQQQIQEQIQQQIQQQIEQQMQQMPPPPSTTEVPPQSFLDKARNFLGSMISALLGK